MEGWNWSPGLYRGSWLRLCVLGLLLKSLTQFLELGELPACAAVVCPHGPSTVPVQSTLCISL